MVDIYNKIFDAHYLLFVFLVSACHEGKVTRNKLYLRQNLKKLDQRKLISYESFLAAFKVKIEAGSGLVLIFSQDVLYIM